MKVRIGMGLGTRTTLNDERFAPFCQATERVGFDSLWVSERLSGDCPDPVVAMAVAAGATQKLKFGMSVMVLPGRNPVVTAKTLASLDRISGGRLLPAFGLGVADPREQQAFGLERKERGPWLEEALPLIRRLWNEDGVTHDGERFAYTDLTIRPKPVGRMEVWLGGAAPRELDRVGRLANGWLPSFTTPDIAAADWRTVNEIADANGRSIDDDHFGMLIPYVRGDEVPDQMAEIIAKRRPDADVRDVVAVGLDGLRVLIERFGDVGASKFVVVPAADADDWIGEVEDLAEAILPLQT
ncbi:MAG: LLM class flavin-dependent oxidoreductase [Actinomycetota bacterium]